MTATMAFAHYTLGGIDPEQVRRLRGEDFRRAGGRRAFEGFRDGRGFAGWWRSKIDSWGCMAPERSRAR